MSDHTDAELTDLMAEALRAGVARDLRQEEVEYLASSERCPACGHLELLHADDQYEQTCRLPGCPCVEGSVVKRTSRLCETCGLVVRRPVDQERCDACVAAS